MIDQNIPRTLMASKEGRAWAITMHRQYPIAPTGHPEFDAMIKEDDRRMKTETKEQSKTWTETPLSLISRGDAVQFRNATFTVLQVDRDEIVNHPETGEIYLWMVQGDSPRAKGKRKSIQGRPDRAFLVRKSTNDAPLDGPDKDAEVPEDSFVG